MGTVIDSFTIELGLDPTKFTKGQQAAYDAAKKLEEDLEKSGKNIESGADRAGEALGQLKTQALSMFAAFAGGKGLLQFSTDLTHSNAQLGRLERNIGVSAGLINAWQGAAQIFGGDAKQMAGSIQSISDAFAGWKIGVENPLIADLRAISTAGGKVIDVNKGVDQSLRDLSENLQTIHNNSPETAGLLGRRIGLDPALFDLLIQGPEQLQKVLDLVNKVGVATKGDTDAFGELEKRMGLMGVKAESIGRQILGGDTGVASKVIRLADWLNESPGQAGSDFASWVSSIMAPAGTPGSGAAPGAQRLFGGAVSASGGAFTSQTDKEAFIRAEAAKRGINPNVAMQVAKNEGFFSFRSRIPGETSYGSYQLHVTPGGKGGHLGDQFKTATGLDPSNADNERQSIQFALDDVAKHGWTAFHGARDHGIGQWEGVPGQGGGSSSQVTIGSVTVVAPAGTGNPTAWGNAFAEAVKKHNFAAQANGGQS